MRFLRKIKYLRKKLGKKIRHKVNAFEIFVADVLYDRRNSRSVKILKSVLHTLSYLFLFIVKLRFALYKNGIFTRNHLGCPVIVVGNLTVGGTGKTPVVEKLAREFLAQGRKVAILSRGYKSKPEKKYKAFWRWLTHGKENPPKVVSDGKRVLLNSYISGDEPYMLARNLPGVIVIVDKDRVKAGRYAIKHFGVDTIILDDGFQYLPLAGHLNLLLVDTTNPFGNGNLLPCGILREPISHVNRAAYVLLTKSKGYGDDELIATIQNKCPAAKIICCRHRPIELVSFNGKSKLGIDCLRGKKIAVFSGIAMPEGFEKFLIENGAEIVFNRRFLDHHRFEKSEIEFILRASNNICADMIVTTEKDAVRIAPDIESVVPLYFLKIDIDILSGTDFLDEAIARVSK